MTDLPERISGRRPIGGDVLVQCDFIGWDADNIEVPKSDTLFRTYVANAPTPGGLGRD